SLAPNLPVLLFGWSFLEGIGAVLILPSIVALVAGNFPVARRPAAYGLVAAAGAVAVAVGPLIGGFCTTYFSWRWVFAGEVVIVLGILVLARKIADAPVTERPKLDVIGVVLSALGLGLFVFGIPRFWPNVSPRLVTRCGLLALLAGTCVLLAALEPDSGPEVVFVPLLLIGLGIGALASQLGAVTVSAVPDDRSPEVGGVQNTMTNL